MAFARLSPPALHGPDTAWCLLGAVSAVPEQHFPGEMAVQRIPLTQYGDTSLTRLLALLQP